MLGTSQPIKELSQTAAHQKTARVPQDLAPFIASGRITKAMLDDPNTVLRDVIAGQTIRETTTISIDTQPAAPLFGGGTDSIAFLQGDPTSGPNANANGFRISATFWIENVERRSTPSPVVPDLEEPVLVLGQQQRPLHPRADLAL